MGKVIYVTGAPATGKSTLCSTLAGPDSGISAFCYSERLRDHVRRETGKDLNETDIRQQSAQIVTAKHVEEVDDLLFQEVMHTRSADTHLLIDSHPVTKEFYGFRVTPFSAERLQALAIDTFICLYAAPDVLAERIRKNAQGRPLPTEFELSVHVQLQASVVAQYSVLAGRPCHLVDSNIAPEELASRVRSLAKLGTKEQVYALA
jgi:adenylate kinase